jgi:two-component system response regulator RegA
MNMLARPEFGTTALVVDSDQEFGRSLQAAAQAHGLTVVLAQSAQEARDIVAAQKPRLVALELKLVDGEAFDVIRAARRMNPAARIVVVSAHAHIPAVVAAVRCGADDVLPKPSTVLNVLGALLPDRAEIVRRHADPVSIRRLRTEYIQRALAENGGRVAATARQLRMHRRTLQRILTRAADAAVDGDTGSQAVLQP